MRKRIVVTGIGIVSPLGVGADFTWQRLLEAKSAVRAIDRFPTGHLACRVAGLVPHGTGPGELDLEHGFAPRETKRNDPFILYARKAADEALAAAGYAPGQTAAKERTGVIIGSAVGGFCTLAQGAADLSGGGDVSAYFMTSLLANMASGQVAIAHGFGGPNFAPASACASGAEAIACAARAILLDEADVVVAGGSDAAVHPLAIAGFARIHALSTHFNDSPGLASRPFDVDCDGFVLADGAGVLVLEDAEHARRRAAGILAELAGCASVSDAYHATATHPEGLGEQRALRQALQRAGIAPGDVDYLNAHATSTRIGDAGEMRAIKSVFGSSTRLAISSTKGATGHTFGAAGAVEAVITILSLQHGVCLPTVNLREPDADFAGMNLVRGEPQSRPLRVVVSTSSGFGSTKVALVFTRP